MTNVGRREFVGGAVACGLASLAARGGQGVAAKIEVLVGEPIGAINPDVYGHFVEHLGGVVYDGVWVGEGSRVPNVGGIRRALVEHLRRVKPSVIRYPGGCFADSYDWRDGVGPRAGKPATFWGLNGSASLAGKTLTLTVVNPHATEAREAEITLRGASARAVRARVLTAADIHAQNTFEDPRAVEPRDQSATLRGAATVHSFAPASVTRLQFDL